MQPKPRNSYALHYEKQYLENIKLTRWPVLPLNLPRKPFWGKYISEVSNLSVRGYYYKASHFSSFAYLVQFIFSIIEDNAVLVDILVHGLQESGS